MEKMSYVLQLALNPLYALLVAPIGPTAFSSESHRTLLASSALSHAQSLVSFSNSSSSWEHPLFSPYENSLNPPFVEAIITLCNALVAVFLLCQLIGVCILKKVPAPRVRRPSLVFWILMATILTFASLLAALFLVTRSPCLATISLISVFLVAPIMVMERNKSVIPLALVLFFWLLNATSFVVAITQDSLSSHAIFRSSDVAYGLEWALFISGLVALILESNFYTPDLDTASFKPYELSSIFSYATFSWIQPLISSIYKSDTALFEDLPRIADDLSCDNTYYRLKADWEVEKRKAERAQAKHDPKSRLLFCMWRKPAPSPSLFKPVIKLVAKYIAIDFIFEGIDIATSYSKPFLLQFLIIFVTKATSVDSEPVPFIIGVAISAGLLAILVIQFMSFNQAFTFQFKITYAINAALTTMIYEKALRLSPQARKHKTTGDIINHVSVDLSMVQGICQNIQALFSSPIKIIVCLLALYKVVGKATYGGVAAAILLIPAVSAISSLIYPLYKNLMTHKDSRTSLIEEILSTIKSIKLYSWEKPMLARLREIRNDRELASIRKIGILSSLIMFLFSCIPFMVSCATFVAFIKLNSIPLTPTIVFPALALFDLLTDPIYSLPMLISSSLQAAASLARLKEFLLLDEVSEFQGGLIKRSTLENAKDGNAVKVSSATFLWSHDATPANAKQYKDIESAEPENSDASLTTENNVALSNINFTAKAGSLTCIVGKVGCGKTTLLRAMNGDLPIAFDGFSEVEDVTSPSVEINGSVAYCPQSPWVLNATIKENILFGYKYDKLYYDATVKACELASDFDSLPDGDMTVVGEKGISLSGGQKARLSLARAVYARADIYILDDILSAVDSHVGKSITRNVLEPSGILAGKTKVLATNSVHVLHSADEIYLVKNKTIVESGDFQAVMDRKLDLAKLIEDFGSKADDVEDVDADAVCPEITEASKCRRASAVSFSHVYDEELSDSDAPRKTGMTEEISEKGDVKLSVFMQYFRACSYQYISIYAVLVLGTILAGIAEKYLLSYWSDLNERMGYTVDGGYYLTIYALLGCAGGLMSFIGSFVVWNFCIIKGAKFFHGKMADSVLSSPMSFFETTPAGRILNRFTDDILTIDMQLPWIYIMFLQLIINGIGTFTVIIINLPMMSLVLLVLLAFYNKLRLYFVPASRELKRLEKVKKSPRLAIIQESINGVDTIKAYGQIDRFMYKAKHAVDELNLVGYVKEACNRWLSIRLQFISSVILFFSSLLAIMTLLTNNPINPGLLGFVMTFALQVIGILNAIIRCWAEIQSNTVSVERIIEYCNLPSEAPMVIEANRPPKNWPTDGGIVFKNYSTKYRANLDPVLKDVNLTIKPAEKIGIVGRTGAGKSSLSLTLFRIIEATTGSIEIDGINTSEIGLFDLRHKLSIIPQEAHTFKGSIRENLDPFQAYSDERLWQVLSLAHLKDHVESMRTPPTEEEKKKAKNPDSLPTLSGLDAKLDGSSSNLSSGQKQLVCLARALLNEDAKILLLDEATASVDVETDKIIQETIRSEFKDKTILTIAHRIDTIMDSDKILVLDKGTVREFDSPQNLLKDKNGLFYSLCKDSGNLKNV